MSDNINEVLGLEQKLNCFTDKKKRTAYPVTMRDFTEFVEKFTFISPDKMWRTMIFEEGLESLKFVLTKTFKDDDVDGIMDQVNAGNYKELIGTIMAINGLDFNTDDDDGKNTKEV